MGRATGSGENEISAQRRQPEWPQPPYTDFRGDVYLEGLREALQEAAEEYMRGHQGSDFDDIGSTYPFEGFEVRSYTTAVEVLLVQRPLYREDGVRTDGVREVRFGPLD